MTKTLFLLTDGIAAFLPTTLVTRPFFPVLAQTVVVAGMLAVRVNPHAERFVRIFREESGLTTKAGRPASG